MLQPFFKLLFENTGIFLSLIAVYEYHEKIQRLHFIITAGIYGKLPGATAGTYKRP